MSTLPPPSLRSTASSFYSENSCAEDYQSLNIRINTILQEYLPCPSTLPKRKCTRGPSICMRSALQCISKNIWIKTCIRCITKLQASQPIFLNSSKYALQFIGQTSSNAIYYNVNPQNHEYLKYVLTKAYNHINNGQQCVLSHFSNCYTIINLNRSPFSRDKKQIKKSYVPITFLLDSQIQDIQSEFGKKLLGFAKTGDYNIKKICEIVQDQKSVYKYYSKCMQMGIVFMLDMFLLQNRYCLTQNIHKYVGQRSKRYQQQLQNICEQVSYRKSSTQGKKSNKEKDFIQITPNVILYLYFQISRKSNLKKIIDDNIQLFQNINILKWIRISQILGIIQRVYEKFAIEDNKQINQQCEFISEQRLKIYIQQNKLLKVNSYIQITSNNSQNPHNPNNSNSSGISTMCSNIKEEYQRMNSLFNIHLKNMDTIDEICVSLKVSRTVLLGLLNFHQQKNLKIFYVTE